MKWRQLGPFKVSAIGLGAMPLSLNHDGVYPDEREAVATVHAALESGITLIDTADIYCPTWDSTGHNERLIGKAMSTFGGDTSDVVISTKGGIVRGEGETWGRDGSLSHLRRSVEASIKALGVEAIDLYQWHRPDRWQVYGDVIESFSVLQKEGKIRTIGISNANVEEIDIAVQVLGEGGLTSVQNQFSPKFRCSHDELEHCGRLGIAFMPWSPLGGTGGGVRTVGERLASTQQGQGVGGRNVGERYSVFADIGSDHGVSAQQIVLAWELSLGSHVIPIPGARRPSSIQDSARAADLTLSEQELARCAEHVTSRVH